MTPTGIFRQADEVVAKTTEHRRQEAWAIDDFRAKRWDMPLRRGEDADITRLRRGEEVEGYEWRDVTIMEGEMSEYTPEDLEGFANTLDNMAMGGGHLLRAGAAAMRENVALKKDAERYQWLHSEMDRIDPVFSCIAKLGYDRNSSEWISFLSSSEFDTAIDVAIAKEQKINIKELEQLEKLATSAPWETNYEDNDGDYGVGEDDLGRSHVPE